MEAVAWPTTTLWASRPRAATRATAPSPRFWRDQWQAIVATSILGVLIVTSCIALLERAARPLPRAVPRAHARRRAARVAVRSRRGSGAGAGPGAAASCPPSSRRVLGGVRLLLDAPTRRSRTPRDRDLQRDEQVEHRPAHPAACYPVGGGAAPGASAQRDRRVVEARDPLQLGDALGDLVAGRASACARCRTPRR